jgi:hypothetical protein
MSSPTNLTDQIAQLRSKKHGTELFGGQPTPAAPRNSAPKACSERRFATDLFMLFAYSLLGIALCTQLFLIVWLDLI